MQMQLPQNAPPPLTPPLRPPLPLQAAKWQTSSSIPAHHRSTANERERERGTGERGRAADVKLLRKTRGRGRGEPAQMRGWRGGGRYKGRGRREAESLIWVEGSRKTECWWKKRWPIKGGKLWMIYKNERKQCPVICFPGNEHIQQQRVWLFITDSDNVFKCSHAKLSQGLMELQQLNTLINTTSIELINTDCINEKSMHF